MMKISRTLLSTVAVAGLAVPAAVATTAVPANAAIPNPVYVNTGWVAYDGGCKAQTELRYWPSTNQVQMRTNVTDPYWFAACRVNSKVYFDTTKGPINDGPTQSAMACAVLDPTCASTTYGDWQTFRPASQTLETLRDFGINLASRINGVRVGLSKA